MIIRVLDDNRARECDKLLTKLIQDEKKYDNSIDENYKVNDYFKNVIKNKSNILLCYEENDIIKGYIFLKQIINDSKKGYLIDGLYVEDKYRNNGIATNLIEESLLMMKDMKVEFIDINVMANNRVATELYKRFGFNEFKISLRKNIF